ncbi:MAG: hypothetical protein IKG95_01510 [Bacteroidales bacterium]|nr:hypothetical protein [Bacteroidales bacterium]
MTNEELKMEDYFQSWNAYRNQLQQSVNTSQRILEGIVHQKATLSQNRLLFRKMFMFVFCLSFVVYLFAHSRLFLSDVRNATPFFMVLALFVTSAIGYAMYLFRLKKTYNYTEAVVDFTTNINKLQLYEKREMLLSFFIALPVLLLTLPQVFSVLLERQDFYSDLTSHLPVLIIGCLLSLSFGYVVYRKNSSFIESIKENINNYKSINTDYHD